MEIEFNSIRPTDAGNNQPIKRANVAPAADASAAFGSTQSLERAIKDLPAVRTEQVERARALVADPKYPPQEMLDRIANLLAVHIK